MTTPAATTATATMRWLWWAAALPALACGGSDPPATPILMGILTPMTGDLAAYGVDVHAGTILAVDEINQAGGIGGRLLQLEARDDGTSDEGSRVAYSNLLRLGVSAVLGPGHSAGVTAMVDEIRDGQTLTVSGSTTAAALASIDDGGYFFRTVPGDDKQGVVLAGLIKEAGLSALCLVNRGDAYGDGLAAVVTAALAPDLVPLHAHYNPADTSLDHVLDVCDPIAGEPARGILFVTFEGDGKLLMNDAIRRHWRASEGAHVFLVDGNRAQRLYDELEDRDAFEGALGTAPGGPDINGPDGLRLAGFRERFEKRWARTPGVHAETNYDAAYLAASALAIAGPDATGDQVRAAMSRTRGGTSAAGGDWAAISAVIEREGGLEYLGASGAVDLDADTGELLPPYYITVWTLENQRIRDVRVETVTR